MIASQAQAGPVSPNAGGHISPPHGVLQREFPPPPPGACFGRDILIEEIVGLAENLKPIALIGGGGIGKTSVALTVLHHDQVKDLFGNNRGFIRCDQFPASRAHFLARLSKVIGAGVESPETLIALRPFLSSHKIFIILDNAESILDPQGTNAQEIYAVVDELCRFKTICLLITSRITTVPRHCKRPVIPALSLEAASNIFYNIYDNRGRSDIVNNLLQRLDFHALSIALLATTASYNMWDYDRMAKEWDAQRAQVLRADSNESLAATIELSLASPTFRKLGPKARDILRVVAFFPQGVDEKNFDRLFPTISPGTGVLSRLSPTTSDRKNILDKFCVLSLTHRCNGFITMLAPIRDYLCPKDLKSSPLLRATKDRYFTRLSAAVHPSKPGFREAEWIRSEDVNVEHLLDVFTSFESGKPAVWKACIHFMDHLYWHKPRQTVLKNKIEGLPDNHPLKPRCLTGLSLLSQSLGNFAEQKRLLSQVIQLERRRKDDDQVARALKRSSDASRMLGLHEEGTQQIREALEIYERVGNITEQAESLEILAWLLYDDKKYAAAEGAVARAIYLFPQRGREFQVCQSHHLLGNIYRNKGEREKAIRHFEVAINIASPFNWQIQLFWPHYSLALLFHDEGSFDDARVHVERAKLYVGGRERLLGRAMELQGRIWHRQGRLEDARSEVFRANEIFERLGAFDSHVEKCRDLFQEIEREIELKNQPTSDKPDSGCEFSGDDVVPWTR